MADSNKGQSHKAATRATPAKEEAKPKRKMLTDEERIAKLEADLKAAREKAEAKTTKAVNELKAKRQILVQQVDERVTKIRDLERQLRGFDGVEVNPFTVSAPPEVSGDKPSTVAAAEGSKPSTTTSRVKD